MSKQQKKEIEAPQLLRISQASRLILQQQPQATYIQIARKIYPVGVLVHLGPRSYRFHKANLLAWLAAGGNKDAEPKAGRD